MTPTRGRALWVAVGLAIYFSLTLAGWSRYPRVWVDEGWIAEPAWSLAHGGPLASPSHGSLHEYDRRLYWMPPFYFLALSAAYATSDNPLMTGRAVSLVAGAAGLLVLIWAGGRLVLQGSGNRTQMVWLAWLLFAFTLDPMLWKMHRSIRFEAMTGCFALAAVCVSAQARGSLAWIGAAFFSGLAALTHPTGILAIPAALGVALSRRDRSRSFWFEFAGLVAIFAVLLLPYLFYLAQDRTSGFSNVIGQNAPHAAGLSVPFLEEWKRYRSYFAWPWLLVPLLLWCVTLVLAVQRRAPAWLLWPIAVFLGGLAFLPNKTEVYLTLVAPFLYLLAVWTGSRLGRRTWVWTGASVWILVMGAADLGLLWRDRGCRYPEWTAPLARALPPGASVAGTFVTWFAVHEHPYFEFHRRRAGDLARVRPDIVIWGDSHSMDPIFVRLRRELGPFLAAHADTVARSVSPCYGNAVMLRPRWDELDPDIARTWEQFGNGEPDS